MIGPPADIEYAVDPVGVQTITPSPEKLVASTPSQQIAIWMTRAIAPLVTTASFSAISWNVCCVPFETVMSSMLRFSIV